MGLNFDAHLDALFLNQIEAYNDTFESEFLERAVSLCLPLLPNEYFEHSSHEVDLRHFLAEFYGL